MIRYHPAEQHVTCKCIPLYARLRLVLYSLEYEIYDANGSFVFESIQ